MFHHNSVPLIRYFITRAAFAFLITGNTITAQEHQDSCYDALRNNVFEQYKTLTVSNYSSKFRDALCNSVDSTNDNSLSGKIKGFFPLENAPPVPIEGGADWNEVKELKTRYCRDTSREIQKDDLLFMMKKVASQTIYDAWLACMKLKTETIGLASELQGADESDFTLRVKWKGGMGLNSVKVKSFSIPHGVTCRPRELKAGTHITTGWLTQPCIRTPNAAGNLTLNVTHLNGGPIIDSISATLGQKPAPPTTPPPAPPPLSIVSVQRTFHTWDDDKDESNSVEVWFYHDNVEVGHEAPSGAGTQWKHWTPQPGPVVHLTNPVPYDECSKMSIRIAKTTNDGWYMSVEVSGTLSDGRKVILLANTDRIDIGNDRPHERTVAFTCRPH